MMFVELFAHFVQWIILFSSLYITLFSFQIMTRWVHEVVSCGIFFSFLIIKLWLSSNHDGWVQPSIILPPSQNDCPHF